MKESGPRLLVWCSIYIVWPSVLSRGNSKLHQTLEVKNIFKQKNVIPQLTFNPGLINQLSNSTAQK